MPRRFPAPRPVGRLACAFSRFQFWSGSGVGAARRAADLLARTVLYKVGHHGSHNATLRDLGLELMTSRELTAMLPVDRPTAKKMDWKMPFPTLYRRLREKTAGRILDLETGLPAGPPDGTSRREWDRFVARTAVHPDWVDYRVEL